MLKKAGIVVATAAVGLLAVSPLAFAGDKGGHRDHGHGGSNVSSTCSFGNAADNSGTRQGATGYEALLGLAGLGTNANAPVTTQANAPVASCNNLNDLVNVNSKNKTTDNSTDNSINGIRGLLPVG